MEMSAKWKSRPGRNGEARSAVGREPAQPEKQADVAIVPANLHALETLYFAAMLEEARLFQVVDRLATMFSQGLLPVGPGNAGNILYRYWKETHNRLTAAQRQTVYARAFGFPGGDADLMPNREFNDLWLRFISTVGMYVAEQQLPREARFVSQDEVRRSGRELAANLSLHGSGLAWFAAQELRPEIQEIIRLLSDPQIENALGGRGLWQVIERVTAGGPGGRPNISRSRTRAESGSVIIRWLANRPRLLLRPPPAAFLKDNDIRKRRTAASPAQKRSHPTDYDLVTACEQWLAVTGTQEALMDEQTDDPVRQE
jgi:hypothetical protein